MNTYKIATGDLVITLITNEDGMNSVVALLKALSNKVEVYVLKQSQFQLMTDVILEKP